MTAPKIVLAALLLASPAQALTIDLLKEPAGIIEVYNSGDSVSLFGFSGTMAGTATYTIMMYGGDPWKSSGILCYSASYHACGYAPNSGFVALAPGYTDLHYGGYMTGTGTLLSASLTIDDRWLRSEPYVEETFAAMANPIPGALPLFLSGLALFGWQIRRAIRA